MPEITVVVPTFNEGANVPELVDRLQSALEGRSAQVLFVDDSTDDTPAVMHRVARTSALPVRVLHREDPVGGLAGAVAEGIRQSDGDLVVVMDGDLQHPPEMVGLLVDTAVVEHVDLVVASRYVGDGDAGGLSSGFRRTVSSGGTVLARTAFPRRVGKVCSDPMTGFFCVRRSAVDLERLRPRGFKILLEILASHDLRVCEIPFVFGERLAGESKASWRNGVAFLLQLMALRINRATAFALVGAVGFLLNLLLMAAMVAGGLHYLPASVVATELTILSNFLLQERVVFSDLRQGRHAWRARAVQSFAYNNLDALVRVPLLVLLVERAHLGAVLAQGLTLVLSFGARFVFTQRVVYRQDAAAPASCVVVDGRTIVMPPTDEEKYSYVRGAQHRWFFWAHFASFVGIAVSLYGFARMRYWTLIFLVPLAVYAAETLLGLWTSTFRRRISLTDHQAVVELWEPVSVPSVDVFIPTAGEDLEILENTYRYVAQIDYPGLVRVYVLDDKNRPEVREAAARWGFEYIARPGSAFKKAGNLQYAFERTSGDHILILDADFVPRHDVLTETVPYMDDDPRIGIIQTPQYYPSHRSLGWLERSAAATQEMFYRFIQPSRDAVEATVCCGTSALYRRAALQAMGGFPQIAHSEDVFTGFNMVQHGYRTAFVPVNLTQGLCPDTIDPYISQQYRWCEGSMELLRMPEFHQHEHVTLRQRASWWSGFFYYVTTAMNGFFAPVPLVIMVWLFPQFVHASNFLPLVGLLVLWLVVYPMLMTHSWRLDVIRVQIIYGFTHAVAIYDMFFGQQAEWVPSNGVNRATPLAIKVKRIMGWYLLAGLLAITAGLAYRLSQPAYSLRDWWALLAFFAVNLYVLVPVVWTCLSTLRADRRAAAAPRVIVLPDAPALGATPAPAPSAVGTASTPAPVSDRAAAASRTETSTR